MTKAKMAIVVVFLLACAGLGAKHGWDDRDGECVANYPRQMVAGRMRPVLHGWTGVMGHWLGYGGAYEHSGDACTYWERVTEAKYSREMYADSGEGK